MIIPTSLIPDIAGTMFLLLVGGFGFGWFRILKETNRLLREQNVDLRIVNKSLEAKYEESIARINKLEGQQKVLVNIPLKQIADHMASQTKLMDKLLRLNNYKK